MREGFDQVNSTISNLSEHVDGKFDEIDDKFAEVDSTLSSIQGLIPDQAYEDGNELADKNFVNSSIETNTATFRGTFNLVSDLELPTTAPHSDIEGKLDEMQGDLGGDNNDYVFVEIPKDAEDPTVNFEKIERYKCVKVSDDQYEWQYEWTLNNSSFTSDQWAAINSGITQGKVRQIDELNNTLSLPRELILAHCQHRQPSQCHTRANRRGVSGGLGGRHRS